MNILDKEESFELSKGDMPLMPIIVKYSIIGSFLLIAMTSFQVLLKENYGGVGVWNSRLNFLFWGLANCIYLLLMILSAVAYKKSNRGFVSFKNACVVPFFVGFFMTMVSNVCFNLMVHIKWWIENTISLASIPQRFLESIFTILWTMPNSIFVLAIFALIISSIVAKDRT
ncbi:MAG: hypothetical protein P1U56_23890 [Saprospiraceae bacterium]|nr:hypothetical protein [Saprospiraceae bacterium]